MIVKGDLTLYAWLYFREPEAADVVALCACVWCPVGGDRGNV